MLAKTTILTTALAALVSADALIYPGHLAAKRDLELAARQTDGGDSATACLEPLLSAYSSLPTAPPELSSISIVDACDVTIPPAVAPVYSSYSSEVVSWFGEHSSAIFSALSQCPMYSSFIDQGGIDVCTSVLVGGAGGGSTPASTTVDAAPSQTGANGSGAAAPTDAAPTTPAGGAGAATTTTPVKAFAARETGFVGAAVAAVGFLGVVAAL
ncbi:hypothetical protein B0H66DRAFT_226433 [Apodospora peruviana]|uniref:DUF7735 domain-containing protein n=1 Tax=Apodospora peruviana TaxID=516989 RepID=A0AAE0M519_9PEZI|nr:hypothetical protein B0H66DRAFT_226433 [Apodospora peruviana]